MSTETETVVAPCCAMCLTVPDDPAAIEKRLEFVEYWLCTNRAACLDRAMDQQHAAMTALEAHDPEPEPAGKHAATGPMKAITDAAVEEMTSAAKATEDTPEDGGACHD